MQQKHGQEKNNVFSNLSEGCGDLIISALAEIIIHTEKNTTEEWERKMPYVHW